MAEFIDRDALLHVIGEMPLDWEYGCAVSDIYEIIKNAPAIDPEDLRPRGRWEDSGCKGVLRCSECKDAYIYEEWLREGKWNYCPNCGARMEE